MAASSGITRRSFAIRSLSESTNTITNFRGTTAVPGTTRALPDGAYVVSVFATDAAGNTGPTDSFAFTIDHLAPVVSIPVPPNQTVVATKTPAFTFADVGPAGTAVTFVCRIDAGADAPCVSAFAVPASSYTARPRSAGPRSSAS